MKKQTWETSGERQEEALYAGFARHMPYLEHAPMPSIWPPRPLRPSPRPEPDAEALKPERVEV